MEDATPPSAETKPPERLPYAAPAIAWEQDFVALTTSSVPNPCPFPGAGPGCP